MSRHPMEKADWKSSVGWEVIITCVRSQTKNVSTQSGKVYLNGLWFGPACGEFF